MSIKIIAAVADGNAIGKNGDLAFHLSADLKRFKQITMGHTVIMGRKTFESLPNGALPGRKNIVITSNHDWTAENVTVAESLVDALQIAQNDAFIIGGGRVYADALPLADELVITHIYESCNDADTFFPEISDDFEIIEKSDMLNEKNIDFQFITYRNLKK